MNVLEKEALVLAPEALAQAGEEPTLDEMMRRDPADHTETSRERLVELLRQERPIFIKAEAERKRR